MFNKRVQAILKIDVPKSSLYVFKNYLFALSKQKNCLFDIADKRSPKLMSNFSLSKSDYANLLLGVVKNNTYFQIGYSGIEVIDFQNEKSPHNLELIKNVLLGAKASFYEDRYLITNPKIPIIYQIEAPTVLSIVYKFSDNKMMDFIIFKNYLLAAFLNEDIKVYDIADPGNPHQISSFKINAKKLLEKDQKTILAEDSDGSIHILNIGNLPNITTIAKIKIPGPILQGSLVCKNDFLFVRFMKKVAGDSTYAFNISDLKVPKRVFQYKSIGMPLYSANDKLLVFMGIKGWDGVQPIAKYTTSFYKVFDVQSEEVVQIGEIELEGVWFSSIELLDTIIYIARSDGIYVYEATSEQHSPEQ